MPAIVVASIIGAAATTGATVYATRKSGQAAALQTQTANHAADVQGQGAAAALQFQKEQAARDQAQFETTQHANYDQWAAREGRLGALGEMIGMGSRNIPGYVPVSQGGTGAPPSGATGASPTGTPVPGGNYQALFQSLTNGLPPTPQALTSLAPKLQQYGIALAPNAAGVNGKIKLPTGQIVDVIEAAGAGGKNWQWLTGGAPTSGASPYLGTASSMLTPMGLSPAVQPWTAASMMGRG